MTAKHNRFTGRHRSLVYAVSRWSRYLFDVRRGVSGSALRAAVARLGDEVAEGIMGSDAPADLQFAAELASDFAGEVFARLYGDPKRMGVPSPDAPWAPAAHGVLDEIDDFDNLRMQVEGDPDFAAIAASDLVDEVADRLGGLIEEARRLEEDVERLDEDAEAAHAALRAALRSAVSRARSGVEEGREALAGLLPGSQHAPPTHEQDDPARMALAERLGSDGRIREVLRRAGRIRRIADRRRRVRDPQGRSEVVDVERGADLARMLPAELARLRHGGMRRLALRRILERQALQYRLEGEQTLGRGPVVVLLDESGSMIGDPHLWARAVGVACVGRAVREGRRSTVVGFDTYVREVHEVEPGRARRRETAGRGRLGAWETLRPEAAALSIASAQAGGGTNFDAVLRYAVEEAGAADDRADLVFVTDGLAHVSERVLEVVAEAKQRGVRVFGLTVNGGSVSDAVRAVCDEVVDLDAEDDPGRAVGEAVA